MKKTSLFIVTLLIATHVMAQIPSTISFQGNLTDPVTGDPVTDGGYTIDFLIYNVAVDGTALWTETQTVSATNGNFSVILGELTPLDPSIFSQSLWLELQLGTEILTPRIFLSTTPYSQASKSVIGSNFIPNSGNVHIGGSLDVGGVSPAIDLAIDDEDTGLEVPADGTLSFYSNGIERGQIGPLGNWAIGTQPDPSYKFSLLTEGSNDDENNWSMYIENNYSGSSFAMGIYNYIRGDSGGEKYGFFADINTSGTGTSYGVYSNHFSGGTGIKYGFYSSGEDRNYFQGSVGIGTTNPGEKLSVNGNIATSDTVKADVFGYNSGVTGSVVVLSDDFSLAGTSNSGLNIYRNVIGDGYTYLVRISGGTAGNTAWLSAPVHGLPHGAEITELEVYFWDFDGTNDSQMSLYSQAYGATAGVLIARVNSSGGGGQQDISTTAITNGIVDTMNRGYKLVYEGMEANLNMGVYSVRISYRFP